MKPLRFFVPAALLLAPVVHASTYFNDFESALEGADLASLPGWTVNDPADQYSAVVSNTALNIDAPTTTSQVINIGDVSLSGQAPIGTGVSYSHSAFGTVGTNSVTFDFLIDDSYDVAFANRDVFGFSLSNSLGNILAIDMVPKQLSADVALFGEGEWALFYRLGNGTRQALQMDLVGGVAGNTRTLFDGRRHDLTMTLNPNALDGNFTDLTLAIRNIDPLDPSNSGFATITGSTTLALSGTTPVETFNLNWFQTPGNTEFGSNSLYLDNLTVVPEPSSALLACVAGIGLVLRRRRA